MFNIFEKYSPFLILLLVPLVVIGAKIATNNTSAVKPIELNEDNFDEEIAKQDTFVMFYTLWCPLSRLVLPRWAKLAQIYNNKSSTVRIAQVNCDEHNYICELHNVSYYPHLQYFKLGKSDSVVFGGSNRDVETLLDFIKRQ